MLPEATTNERMKAKRKEASFQPQIRSPEKDTPRCRTESLPTLASLPRPDPPPPSQRREYSTVFGTWNSS